VESTNYEAPDQAVMKHGSVEGQLRSIRRNLFQTWGWRQGFRYFSQFLQTNFGAVGSERLSRIASQVTTTTIIVIVVVFQGLGLLACSGSELIF